MKNDGQIALGSILALLAAVLISGAGCATKATTLIPAAQSGDYAGVKKCLEQETQVNSRDAVGATALIWAAHRGHADIGGHKDVVRLLISSGAEVDARDEGGWTALIGASVAGQTEVAGLLIEEKADINAQDNNGYTALIWAAQRGHKEMAELLLEQGADVNLREVGGNTALGVAAKWGKAEIVNMLQADGAEE